MSPGASERQHQLALLELSALQSRLQIQAFFFPLKKNEKKKKNQREDPDSLCQVLRARRARLPGYPGTVTASPVPTSVLPAQGIVIP